MNEALFSLKHPEAADCGARKGCCVQGRLRALCVCVNSRQFLPKVFGNASQQESQLHRHSGEDQNTPLGVSPTPPPIMVLWDAFPPLG